MSARHKLNQAYVQGAMVIAGFVAASAQSWTLFMALSGILIALSLHSGDIRPRSRDRR